ncbi:hypothetical protein PMIN07_004043 [Paraphaeosphaeria minitans]
MTSLSGGQNMIKALICGYFLAMGHLEKIHYYDHFELDFKAACARMNKKSNITAWKPRKSQNLPPHTGVSESGAKSVKLLKVLAPKPVEHEFNGNESTNTIQDSTNASNPQNATSTPESPSSKIKRLRRELNDPFDLLHQNNKRLKIEIGELQAEKEELETEMRLQREEDRLRQELQEEKANTQKLRKEVALKEQARADAESQLEMERDLANQALAAKARLEYELERLKSAQEF